MVLIDIKIKKMSTILISFIVLLLIFFAMSIGVIFGRKPIAGSCGGLKTMGEVADCEICGGDPAKCK